MEWLRLSSPDPRRRVVRLTFLGLLPLGPTVTVERYAAFPHHALPRWWRRWQALRWGRELPWPRATLLWLRGEGG